MDHAARYEPPANPADRPLVTLDTNALIALREGEPAAADVGAILALNRIGAIAVNVTLSTALEAPRAGATRGDLRDVTAWLRDLGIAPSSIFTSPRAVGFRTADNPDAITFDGELERALNARIHALLFPTLPFDWREYRDREGERHGASRASMAEFDAVRWDSYIPSSPSAPRHLPTPVLDALDPAEREVARALHGRLHRRWANAKADALGLYNHITHAWHTTHPEWAVFVTSDGHFLRADRFEALHQLGVRGEILPPAAALARLRAVTGVWFPLVDEAASITASDEP